MAVLSEMIRHDRPLRTGRTAVYPYDPVFESRYRFTSRFDDEVVLYRVDAPVKEIHLPRALCPIGDVDERVDGAHVEFEKCAPPRPHQVQVSKDLVPVVQQDLSGIVVAPTGAGKTWIGCYIAWLKQRKTCVVVTKEDIFLQWYDAAKNFLGLDDSEIGIIRGDRCEVIGTKFVIAMIQSLSKEGRYPDWAMNDFGLVIWDECHRVAADQFSNSATMFPAKLRIGLSATPERQDGKELLIYAHIGPVRASIKAQLLVPKVFVLRSSWECPRVLRPDPDTGAKKVVRLPHQAGKTTHVEKMLAADPVRNHLIAELIQTAHAKGRKIVVFSTLLDHLKTLHAACRKLEIPVKDMGMYVGAKTKAEIQKRDREAGRQILFTTYSMMGEGTDLPWLDCCILAMPRSKITQPLGRIRREYDGKPSPVAFDIVDDDSPVFHGYANSRLAEYQNLGAEVVHLS